MPNMKIVIAGAGEVGFHLAKMMCSEARDIYIIDDDAERLNHVLSQIDVYGIVGNGKDVAILKEANIGSCDLFIAATSSEETNLMGCIMSKKLGAKKTIARISSYQEVVEDTRQLYLELGVDQIISPVRLAAEEILRLINQSAFTDDYEFENGKLSVFGISIKGKKPLIDKTISETAYLNANQNFKPLALLRGHNTIIVNSDTILELGDIVYFISKPESIDVITKICGQENHKIKNIMILGGSNIGVLAAQLLQKKYNVTLIEKDKVVAAKIAAHLKKTLIINSDGRDVGALEEENIQEMDAFISVTGDSETNIISSLVAKSHNVKKTIARVENIDYINLSQNIGVDTLINKKVITASNIFKYIRKGEVEAIMSLHGTNAEIIEFNAKENTKIVKKHLKALTFPSSAKVAGVIREDKGFIPFGDFQIIPGDKVIVFCASGSVNKIEKFFN